MDEIRARADDNLHLHMRWVQERTPGMRAVATEELLLVDSGLPTDTFNFISRARLQADTAPTRILEAIAHFERAGRPFSWWLGLTDTPAELGALLESAGLRPAESETAMAIELDALEPVPAPEGLIIERVTSAAQLDVYARLLAELATPPDDNVRTFFRLASPALLDPACALRLYVGRLDGTPVATAEMTLHARTAGMYNISTAESARGRGIGSALTAFPLLDARAAGCTAGVLQAAENAVGVYRRVGFRSIGRYTEYR